MKFFISALVIILLTGTVCVWGANESVKRIDDMLTTLDITENEYGTVPHDALALNTEEKNDSPAL